jgi:SAM-dependent methyltransferase
MQLKIIDNHELIQVTYAVGFMILILSCLLSLTTDSFSRDWEQWDRGRVAEVIDAYWLASPNEIDHRKALAALVKQWILPNERFLEIGCGSGLVYKQLVPSVLPNFAYVGIDNSKAMLNLAHARSPEGNFFKDDLYGLSFPDNFFEVTAAFEVFGHIDDIEKPIAEMFRTASRLMIFTVWTGPNTKVEQENIESSVFIRTTFSLRDVLSAIERALRLKPYAVHVHLLSHDKTAFIIDKL